MDSSSRLKPVVFAVIVMVSLAGAFWAGRFSVRDGEKRESPEREVGEKVGGVEDQPCVACAGEVAALRKQVSRLRRRAAATEASAKLRAALADGREEPEDFEIDPEEPVAWPDNTPELFMEESFRDIASEMAEQAGSSVELLAVDCEEAPCYAALTVGTGEFDCLKMPSSPAWSESYPGGCSAGAAIKTCDDGTRGKICIIGKGWDGWSDRTKKHVMERATVRRQNLLDAWGCSHQKRE